MRTYTTKELGAKMAQMRKARSNNEISGKEYNAFYDALPMFFDKEFISEAFKYSVGVTMRKYSKDYSGVYAIMESVIGGPALTK